MPTLSDYAYNLNIPNGPNNPSNDQPLMQTNANNIASIFGEDHVGFNSSNQRGGCHNQARLVNNLLANPPGGLAAGMGTLYTKYVITNGANKESTLFYEPDNSGNEYQITRTIAVSWASFGTNNAYGTPPGGFTQIGGWVFLPGGLLFQYGTFGTFTSAASINSTIQFPVSFSTAVYTINITSTDNSAGTGVTVVKVSGTPGLTSFVARGPAPATLSPVSLYWTAIGN
jgi:hypothetical protein